MKTSYSFMFPKMVKITSDKAQRKYYCLDAPTGFLYNQYNCAGTLVTLKQISVLGFGIIWAKSE